MPLRLALALLRLPALLGGGGCRQPPAPPASSSDAAPQQPASTAPPRRAEALADDLGRVWQGKRPPRRVISLAPNVTEIVCAIGGRSRLVGIDTASDYPPQVKSIPRVGDFLRPSVEQIVAARADAILLSSATITPQSVAELENTFRAPIFVLNPVRLPDVARNVRSVGRLLGLEAPAEAVAREMERQFAAVARAVAGRPRRSVFLEMWHEPLQSVGPKTFLDDLIRTAGGRNVAAAQPRPFPTFSLEALLAADPEVYIVASMAQGAAGDPTRRSGFGALRAVRTGRVCRVPADPVLRPTPRLAEGIRHLARAIHPEVF